MGWWLNGIYDLPLFWSPVWLFIFKILKISRCRIKCLTRHFIGDHCHFKWSHVKILLIYMTHHNLSVARKFHDLCLIKLVPNGVSWYVVWNLSLMKHTNTSMDYTAWRIVFKCRSGWKNIEMTLKTFKTWVIIYISYENTPKYHNYSKNYHK